MRYITDMKGNITELPDLPDIRTAEEIAKEALDTQIAEAKKYLNDTDFKMTVDYYATMTAIEQTALTDARATARAFLIANGY